MGLAKSSRRVSPVECRKRRQSKASPTSALAAQTHERLPRSVVARFGIGALLQPVCGNGHRPCSLFLSFKDFFYGQEWLCCKCLIVSQTSRRNSKGFVDKKPRAPESLCDLPDGAALGVQRDSGGRKRRMNQSGHHSFSSDARLGLTGGK
jgi:hypothetical protein